MILAALLAAATFFTGACHQSTADSTTAAQPQSAQAQAAQTSPAQRPELHAEDFDPRPDAPPALKISGQKAFQNLKDFVALGPRPLGSSGHLKAEQFILAHLDGAQVEQDKFNVQTAAGPFAMDNIVAKFPGKKDGVIVLAGHYDTNYPLRNTSFVGANDGGSNVGLMLEIASQLRQHETIPQVCAGICPPQLEGYSIWLLFTDGEEATVSWTDEDSVYGAKHLAKKWSEDGTAARIKALLLLDMIGDKNLDLDHETNSTPWLAELVYRAAQRAGQQSHFSSRVNAIQDDHLPFRAVGIPVDDIIDLNYGFDNLYHHTTQDTADKCSAASLQSVGEIVMESIRALNTH
jgi:hypothetical protein